MAGRSAARAISLQKARTLRAMLTRARSLGGGLSISAAVAWTLSAAALAGAGGWMLGCEKELRDPSATRPTQPSETAGQGEQPPATLQTIVTPAPMADPLAEHRATKLILTGLSQITRPAPGVAIIDLRFDALDDAGLPARMAGDLRVVIRAPSAEPEHSAFDIPLQTVKQQAKHFDETLLMYVVRLEPRFTREPAAGSQIEVTATLASRDGRVIESSGRVAW
jgi:hypothetical protein